MGARALLLAALCVQALRAHCPRLCDCKWKGGKESVLCPGANLTRLPAPLDPGTQLLDLSDNPLVVVQRDAFAAAGLLNLQKVYFAKCRLKTLDRYAFRELINLVELDLGHNALSAVPSHALDSVPELRELRLGGNPIRRVLDGAFSAVPQLVRLDLSDCRLTTVEPRAFEGLEVSLEWLRLDRNRLTDVRASTLTSLKSLRGLELADNPWNCTCGLRPLREWTLRRNVPFDTPPACRHPARVAGKSWERMELDEFACAPSVSPTEGDARADEGDNATLSCRVTGEPPPRVIWLLRNRALADSSTAGTRRGHALRSGGGVAALTVLAAEGVDAGVYTCAAENLAGRAEAVVRLTVGRRTGAAPGGGLALAAGAAAALLVLAACLLLLRLRTRSRAKPRVRPPPCTRHRSDSYEKIELNRKPAERPPARPEPEENAARRRGDYRHVPSQDTEDEAETYDEEMETPTPTGGARGWRDAVAAGGAGAAPPAAAPGPAPPAAAAWLARTPSEPAWAVREDADLHIPRLSEYRESRIDISPESSPGPSEVTAEAQNRANNNIARPPLDHQNNLPSSDDKNYPDLLELPRAGSADARQAPGPRRRQHLQPTARNCRLNGNARAAGSSSSSAAASATPLLQLRGLPRAQLARAPPGESLGPPLAYDYHAAQLERFLEEYRSLQEQLCKMKETCESLGSTSGEGRSQDRSSALTMPRAPSRASPERAPWTTTSSLSGRSANGNDFFRS